VKLEVGDYVYYESHLRKGRYGICKIEEIVNSNVYGKWKTYYFVPSIREYENANGKSYGHMPIGTCVLMKPDNINKRIGG
jgi:hypothetical protein